MITSAIHLPTSIVNDRCDGDPVMIQMFWLHLFCSSNVTIISNVILINGNNRHRVANIVFVNRVRAGPDLKRCAVLREGGAKKGIDSIKNDVDDVPLQDGIRETLLSFITHLHIQQKHLKNRLFFCVFERVSIPLVTLAMSTVKSSKSFQMWFDV